MISGGTFSDFVSLVYKNNSIQSAKKIVNSLTGSLGTKYTYESNTSIINDEDFMFSFVAQQKKNNLECVVSKYGSNFVVTASKKNPKYSNTLPIYRQIIHTQYV